MWICQNCDAEVPDNFDVCWNCQNERGTSNLPPVEPEEKPVDLRLPINKDKQINFARIVSAGKQLKQVVIAYLIIVGLALILTVLAEAANWYNLYFLIAILGILLHVIILSKIYFAGSLLEKSVEDNIHNNSQDDTQKDSNS